MNRRLLLAILLVLPIGLRAQSSGNTGFLRTDLISPSPTAANLGKYGDVPVSYYTGLPNVSIPIFNVTGNELSLPITLTYNYSGFQPTQKAGWVGLGWSLQAGGVITRSIGDKIDGDTPNPYDKVVASNINPTQQFLKSASENAQHDTEPDVFSFNFGNYSGKFIWYNNEAYLMPFQKLKITGGPTGFTITTEDGTKYEFLEVEMTSPRPSAGSYTLPSYVSALYLTKITNASNTESIRLEYDNEGTMLQLGMRSQSYNKFMQSQSYLMPGYTFDGNEFPSSPSDVFPTRVNVKRLLNIISDKYFVRFIPGELREDVDLDPGSTSKTLQSIHVLSNELDSQNELTRIKKVDLEYEYFGTSYFKYLKLKSVTEVGSLNSSEPAGMRKYTFDYERETESFGVGLDSYVDKFNYLKGTISMPNNMYITPDVYSSGTNRDPEFSYARSGALSKITYPTGGSTSFTYESNRYYSGNQYIVIDDGASQTVVRSNPSTTNVISAIDTFNITTGQYVNLFYSRVPKYIYPPGEEPTYIGSYNDTDVEIYPVYNILDDEGLPIGETVGDSVYAGEITLYANNGGQADSVFLNPGKYILKVICDDEENEVYGTASFKIYTDTPVPGSLGPGIRIKSLVHNNGFGLNFTKNLYYVDENGFSSGILHQNASFNSNSFYKSIRDPNLFGGEVGLLQYTSYSSVLAESPGIGIPLYYSRVVEENSSEVETHTTAYSYTHFDGYIGVELVKKIDFLSTESGLEEKSILENTFSSVMTDDTFLGMKIRMDTTYVYLGGGPSGTGGYTFQQSINYCLWKHPVTNKQTQIENGQTLVSETKNYYDVNGTRNLIGVKRKNSDGTQSYIRYKYPEDYSILAYLTNAHIVSPVIEEQEWKILSSGDSVMIRGRINEYNTDLRLTKIYSFESEQDIPSLLNESLDGNEKYNTLISDPHYQQKIEFLYDASGRIISQKLENNYPNSYLWGYPAHAESGSPIQGNTYPIAEIKNAEEDKVFYTSFEDSNGTIQSAKTGLRSHTGTYTLPSFVGDYKLTYWKKTGTNGWVLIAENHTNPTAIQIGDGSSIIDEVRLYPKNAILTTYTYRLGLGISSVNDSNNNVSVYEYDSFGRLKVIKDDKGNILSNYKYHNKDEGTIGVE